MNSSDEGSGNRTGPARDDAAAVAFDRLMTHIAAGLDAAVLWLVKERGIRVTDIRVEHEMLGWDRFVAIRERRSLFRKEWRRVFVTRVTLPDMSSPDEMNITVEHVWLDPELAPIQAITEDGAKVI